MRRAGIPVYFSAPRSTSAQISGTTLLAHRIRLLAGKRPHSEGKRRYHCVVPLQNISSDCQSDGSRLSEIIEFLRCHAAIFDLSGTTVDPQTLAMAQIAQLLDIPSVHLRTDVPNAEHMNASEFSSWFPWLGAGSRSVRRVIDSSFRFAKIANWNSSKPSCVLALTEWVARRVLDDIDEAMDTAISPCSLHPLDRYLAAAESLGYRDHHIFKSTIAPIIQEKSKAGLIS